MNTRVTIIDDDERFLSSVRRSLERVGIDVTTFVDSRCAIESIVKGLGSDLLILDLTMPDFDGIEFMADLAKFSCQIPVLLVSGWWPETLELAASIGRGIGLDIIGAYEKPFDLAQIHRHLGTKSTTELKIEK